MYDFGSKSMLSPDVDSVLGQGEILAGLIIREKSGGTARHAQLSRANRYIRGAADFARHPKPLLRFRQTPGVLRLLLGRSSKLPVGYTQLSNLRGASLACQRA